jgi:serine/threonine-protein kinase
MNSRDALLDTLYDGRYRIKRRIGQGGMANVYLADDETLGRQVAIKVLNERYADDEQFVERFLREASSAARLNHPNIVQVYDRGESDGTYYIAMEYVDGMTLKELIGRRGSLSQDEVLGYGRQALNAMRFAHRNGVVHRDIKPHNMMVDHEGRLKIADFGIARAGADSGLTEVGSIVGTAQYLAPEQARGETVSAASDLYSLGVVMFEMATGRVPFDGDSPVNVALKHVNDPVPHPRSINPNVSTAVEAIILRAMQKDPANRYQTADELLADIDSAKHGAVSSATQAMTQVMAPAAGATTVLPGAGLAPPPRRDVGGGYANANDDYTRGAHGSYYDDDDDVRSSSYATGGRREPQRTKRKTWPWVLLVLLLLAIAAAAFALMNAGGDGGTDQVRVPDVKGFTQRAATREMKQAGLHVATIELKSSDDVTAGQVIDTNPDADEEVDKGSDVTLIVSKGVGKVAVPNVIGKRRTAAINELRALGFEVRSPAKFSDEPKGTVIAQDPDAGSKLAKGETVSITVSKGPNEFEVPLVVGLQEDEATHKLEDAGFHVRTHESPGPETAGEVTNQDPGSGETVEKGATVTITVASGKNEVPDVVEDGNSVTPEDAKAELTDAGFKVTVNEVEDPTLLPGDTPRVTDQDPNAGQLADVGSTVTITVSKPPPGP